MQDMNTVFIIGRLTKDSELKQSETGSAYIHNSVAINRRKKSGDEFSDETSFFDVAILGKLAETLEPYLKKGKQVCIRGELKQARWEKEGKPLSRVEIIVDEIQLLGGNKSKEETDVSL